MALVGTSRGTGGNATSGTSLVITPASNFTAGSMGILSVAYDNSGTQGADPFSSLTDSAGNTWSIRINSLNDPGAANAGMVTRVYTSPISSLTTSNNITINFSVATVAKVWILQEMSSDSGGTVNYIASNFTPGTTNTQSITTGATSLAVGDAVVGFMSIEWAATGWTADTDTLDGTWSAALSASSGGSTGAAVFILSQRKIVTGTSVQTFNTLSNATSDNTIGWIHLRESAGGTTTTKRLGLLGIG